MYERIVVPVDLSERNKDAVETAARLAGESGTVYLLHVIEIIAGMSVEDEPDFYQKLEKRAGRHLEHLGALLEERGTKFEAEIAYGSRAKTILNEASKLDADLIVLRSHRVDSSSPSEGWGTLSYQIGILSDRPVLLVK